MAKKRRDYDNDFPSVTQCLDVLRKIGLEIWYKQNTPEFIAEESRRGKEIGTTLHEAIQAHIEETEVKVVTSYPDEVMTVLNSFMLFKKEHPEIKLHKAEIKMTSPTLKCNGTLDCIGEKGGLLVVDWKSGKAKEKEKPPIYDEYVDQVSAYVNIYNEVNACNIDRALIVAMAKDKVAYDIKEINADEIKASFENVFLPSLKIWYHKNRRR